VRIGIPREEQPGETLVSATPKTVAKLISLGYEVIVEAGAGAAAKFPDDDYVAAGASLGTSVQVWAADIVTKVIEPTTDEVARLAEGAVLIDRMAPTEHPELIEALQARRATGLNLLAIPRISRAQSMDVLSTMSNIAGYRGVIDAAESYGGMFAGQVTAAGKTQPATVFIIGAGVAGLAAIGAAVRLGAQVRAFDVRPEDGEQIESMGATFVQAAAAQQQVSADGYAQKLTEDQEAATQRMYAEESAKADIVITTALVRGWAPTTITAEMVAKMKPGSVIVDLAAVGGGNCEATVPGEKVVTDNGVTIIGYTDLPSRLATQSSTLYANNLFRLSEELCKAKDGAFHVNMEDEVIRGATVVKEGEVTWPPPAPKLSAAPARPAAAPAPAVSEKKGHGHGAGAPAPAAALAGVFIAGAIALLLIGLYAPPAFLPHFTVFVLACFVGYMVVWNVTPALHTPLMSVTNAISSIIIIGALIEIAPPAIAAAAGEGARPDEAIRWIAAVGIALTAINMFGGFAVTQRMLSMFRK
jgi:NAD(P) transhydrogenase subunit alpha